LHRDFNNFSANSAQHIASNTKKPAYFREEPTSSSQLQYNYSKSSVPCRKNRPKSRAHTSKTHFPPLFWQTTAVALHSFSSFFSNFTHHPGLAGIVKKRNCLVRPRISRKSTLGTATYPEPGLLSQKMLLTYTRIPLYHSVLAG